MFTAIIKKITALVLVFVLFAQHLNTLVVIGDFLINQEIIAKTLCIQRDVESSCNGKCQLTKELAQNKNESNDDAPSQERERLVLDVFCLSSIHAVQFQFETSEFKSGVQVAKNQKITTMYLDVDTPPPNLI